MIFTIGYQRFTLQKLIEKLDEHKIELLIDVRSIPHSHNPQFCKANLEKVLGKRYMWLGDTLGGKKGVRQPGYHSSLHYLAEQSAERNVCIMCMEAEPTQCHRDFWIAKDLKRRFNVDVLHLFDKKTAHERREQRAQRHL